MRSQWNPNDEDVPAKMVQVWGTTRTRAATGKVVAIAASVVALVLIIAFVIAMATNGTGSGTVAGAEPVSEAADDGSQAPDEDTPYPGDGIYTIQVSHTGYCLGTGEQTDGERDAVLIQTACKGAEPQIQLAETSTSGTYLINLLYPKDDYTACLEVDGKEPDNLLGPQQCSDDERQLFTLEPAGDGLFHVITAGGLCLDVRGQSADENAELGSAECSETSASQRYRFDAKSAAPSRPTRLGAWWARDGVYAAKWEAPIYDGGNEISGYVVRDCDGDQLAEVDADVLQVEVEAKKLTCVSVRAVNAAGEGDEATFQVTQKLGRHDKQSDRSLRFAFASALWRPGTRPRGDRGTAAGTTADSTGRGESRSAATVSVSGQSRSRTVSVSGQSGPGTVLLPVGRPTPDDPAGAAGPR